jgi:hypothetical protein
MHYHLVIVTFFGKRVKYPVVVTMTHRAWTIWQQMLEIFAQNSFLRWDFDHEFLASTGLAIERVLDCVLNWFECLPFRAVFDRFFEFGILQHLFFVRKLEKKLGKIEKKWPEYR